jgi:multidrug/hemolysin transport system permease protein
MKPLISLVGRNLRIFSRDRVGVFLSMLSPLILFLLYALFLGNQQVEALGESFPGAERAEIEAFINTWVFSGIVMITTVTTGLQAMNALVEDQVQGRFKDFLVSPVSRGNLVAGYLVSAMVISLGVTVLVFAIGQTYLSLSGQSSLSLIDVLQVLGYIALLSVTFAALTAFLATFIPSTSGFTALATIVGTVMGFIAAIYVPMGILPDGVANVISALPFAIAAMLLRGPLTSGALAELAGDNAGAREAMESFYGLTISVGEWTPTTVAAVFILLGVAAMFTLASLARIRGRVR